jgi:ABC-type transport system substrate-binding protein
MEYAPMIGALAGLKHDMFLLAWGWMSGEPSQALRQVLGGESTWNFEGYNDEEFNRILKKAEVMLDWKERMNLYNQAYKLAFNEVVIIPILHYRNIYAANKKVKDIYASPREILELNTAYVGSN